jgi:probable rRNA maturation factor
MQDLNLKYRGLDKPTNVLSFAQQAPEDVSLNPDLLGDVVICGDRAAADADELGYTVEEMTVYLLIHGVLHLLGHHHDEPEPAQTMETRVQQIFDKFFPEQ